MRFSPVLSSLLLGGSSVLGATTYSPTDISNGNALKDIGKKAYDASVKQVSSNAVRARGPPPPGACTSSNLKVRREWRSLTADQRKSFVAAVKCVQSKPSSLPPGLAAGAKHLYDDFVAIHMNQTIFIHLSATFLTWHRYFIHTYEQKLNACGYKGALPYWEWSLDAGNIHTSPLFDGSATSLGSDGAYVPHGDLFLGVPGVPGQYIQVPAGQGGGCVSSGPFSDMTVHLGPIALPVPGSTNTTGVTGDFFQDNSRCLRRDLCTSCLSRYASFRNITDLLLNYNTVELFQAVIQADPRYQQTGLGPHGGGHYAIGGNPGGDVFVSPGDPAFYLHHAQVDRMYWLWQAQDFAHRQNVFGTGTLLNTPPSPNVTVNDYINISPLNTPVQIKSLMSTLTGAPLCYVYL